MLVEIKEILENLDTLIKHFEEQKEKAQTSQEYSEYFMAVYTLEESKKLVTAMASLGYLFNYINGIT